MAKWLNYSLYWCTLPLIGGFGSNIFRFPSIRLTWDSASHSDAFRFQWLARQRGPPSTGYQFPLPVTDSMVNLYGHFTGKYLFYRYQFPLPVTYVLLFGYFIGK